MKNTKSIDIMQRNAARAEAILKQIANAKRLMILCNLIAGEKSVGELEALVNLSQSALSQHLSKLRLAGLIRSEKRGKMVYYRICSVEAQALLSTVYMVFCKK